MELPVYSMYCKFDFAVGFGFENATHIKVISLVLDVGQSCVNPYKVNETFSCMSIVLYSMELASTI